MYVFAVVIIFNFFQFILIAAGQVFIYFSIQTNSMKTIKENSSRDATIAARLISVALTDFLCWFPIGLLGIINFFGINLIDESINVAMTIFILPFNSAVNPFLYTFNVLMEIGNRKRERALLVSLERQLKMEYRAGLVSVGAQCHEICTECANCDHLNHDRF